VLVLSLEMSAHQIVQRMLCSEAKVDSQAVRTGYLSSSDWHRLTAAAGRLSEANIFIDDSPGLTVLEARAKARRMKAEHGLDLLVIDYLQLMRGRASMESRQQEISEISRSLKALAKELRVPVVALSQLSRAVESRATRDFRPQLSDLRESGALEQDADLILFLYRQSAYKEDLPPDEANITEVIIGKQRNGPVGTIKVVFLPQYARTENCQGRYSLVVRESKTQEGDFIIGQNPKMREIAELVARVAPAPTTVFVRGESGTGKELVARAINKNPPLRDKPLLTVNCTALTPSLMESELFGHRRGAFTGAIADKVGLFEKADGGTIFLDEIGDMPLEV